jgi:hypothetical protein
MNETFEYLERRLEPQRKWHNGESLALQRAIISA